MKREAQKAAGSGARREAIATDDLSAVTRREDRGPGAKESGSFPAIRQLSADRSAAVESAEARRLARLLPATK